MRWNQMICNRFQETASCLDLHVVSLSGCCMAQSPSRNPSGAPGGLEIEASSQAIQVQQLSSKIEAGTDAAFHGLEIHFAQAHAAASNEFIFVEALADHLKFCPAKLMDELMLGGARKSGPPGLSRDPGTQNQLFPKSSRESSIGDVHHESRWLA